MKEEWTQLRSLLLAPEQTQLDELRERLDNPTIHARDVSRVLPDALAIRGIGDQHLSTALAPYVEQAFAAAVRKSPRAIVDAIAPIMGPAIRQAIARTLQGMVQSLNHSLDQSFSIRGLRWRLEAWRTGRPFAEVVLLHTLRYRVEQVFLIHRETGLLLHHAATDAAVVQDQHLVSGMLAAIQRYVQDSFGASQDHTLDQFQVGEWTVWIEQGSQAFLAGVIRGTPPAALRQRFRDALDRIQIEQGEALALFHGDSTPFNAAQTHLEDCLQAHYDLPNQPHSIGLWVLGGLILLGLAWWAWVAYHAHAHWSDFLSRLKAEPGIVVTTAESTLGGYRLEGLRDPLAMDPSTMVTDAGIDRSKVTARWSPYYALDSGFIVNRARSLLQPPDTVSLRLEGDILVSIGSAPVEWAREARRMAPFIPGVGSYRDSGLTTISISDLLTQINQSLVRFPPGSSTIEPSESARLQSVITALREIDKLAEQSGQRVTVEILGSADETGPETINLMMSEARARAVLAAIGGKRFGKATTLTTSIGTPLLDRQRQGKGSSSDRRSASLHVSLAASAVDAKDARP